MASASLSRSISASPTNPDKFTVSMWVKKSKSAEQVVLGNYASSNFRAKLQFKSDDKLEYYQVNDGGVTAQLKTNRLFRDTHAWYHLLVQFDTSQGTASDRIKIYINGTQETSFETSTYPAQNLDMRLNQASTTLKIGQDGNSGNYFDGQMAHVHLADGQTYAPSTFGQTDTTTGIWKPKTAPSVTYGDDGFFLKMDNSANMGLDSSGQTNNFTTSGTIIQTKDTPSNVYSTLNASALGPNSVLSNVSNTCAMNAAAQFGAYSTLGVNSGKWYMEMKYSARTHSYDRVMVGIAGNPNELRRTPAFVGQPADPTSYGYYVDGTRYQNDNSTAYGSSYTVNDIIGIALDLENNRLFFSKNGTWQDSGDPTSSTGAISITAPSSTTEGSYFFAVSDTTGSYGGTIQCNFGNGYFGTTAITSAGSNGNGSLFEYDVPTGYYALNTQNLGTQS